jgi:Ca2+/H+ antiporter
MARVEIGPGDPLGPDEFDGPAEVAAAARTQRRIAVGYGLVFVVAILAVPVLTLTLPWWSTARLVVGMSPSFVTVAVGLYVFFLALGVAVSTLAHSVEVRMLGTSDDDEIER